MFKCISCLYLFLVCVHAMTTNHVVHFDLTTIVVLFYIQPPMMVGATTTFHVQKPVEALNWQQQNCHTAVVHPINQVIDGKTNNFGMVPSSLETTSF